MTNLIDGGIGSLRAAIEDNSARTIVFRVSGTIKLLAPLVIKHGDLIIDSQAEVGGWPLLHSAPAPQDRDHDGMADVWERAHGLDPANPEDRNGDFNGDGYTNLEKYLNSLAHSPI